MDYPKIKPKDLKDCTAIFEVGKNWLTKWGMKKLYGFDDPIFTHAFFYIGNGDCVNVSWTTFIVSLNKILKPNHIYYTIRFTDLTNEQIANLVSIAYRKAGSKAKKLKLYDIRGYLYFAFRPYMGWLKSKNKKVHNIIYKCLKPSSSADFCSDQGCDILQEAGHPYFAGIDCEAMSPCHLFHFMRKYRSAEINIIDI